MENEYVAGLCKSPHNPHTITSAHEWGEYEKIRGTSDWTPANYYSFRTCSWVGTDHTREQTPILCFSPQLTPGTVGLRTTFADIGESVAHWLGLAPGRHGRSFL